MMSVYIINSTKVTPNKECILLTIFRINVASVGSVFNDTRKVKVLSLPETIKQKSTFRAKALRRELAVGVAESVSDKDSYI